MGMERKRLMGPVEEGSVPAEAPVSPQICAAVRIPLTLQKSKWHTVVWGSNPLTGRTLPTSQKRGTF